MNNRIVVVVDGEVSIVFVYTHTIPGKESIVSQLHSFGEKFDPLNFDLLFCMKPPDNALHQIIVIKRPDVIDDIGVQFLKALVKVEEVLKYNFQLVTGCILQRHRVFFSNDVLVPMNVISSVFEVDDVIFFEASRLTGRV